MKADQQPSDDGRLPDRIEIEKGEKHRRTTADDRANIRDKIAGKGEQTPDGSELHAE